MIAAAAKKKIGAATSEPTFRVGDERLVKLTEAAGKKVGGLLTKQGRPEGVLRVAVTGGGCSGLQYKMDLQDKPANRDILVESAGVKVVVDPKRERNAVREARKLGIATVALIDTDCDPDEVDLPVPGNDDSFRSIELIARLLADSVLDGKGSGGELRQRQAEGAVPASVDQTEVAKA